MLSLSKHEGVVPPKAPSTHLITRQPVPPAARSHARSLFPTSVAICCNWYNDLLT